MRITQIIQKTYPLNSKIKNAVIDFSQMTVSVVAIHTDKVSNGKPIIGYGFNSNGRYSQEGILKDRIIPRLLNANAEELLENNIDNLDPAKCYKVMMKNEKPGGHGERSVAVGAIDMALWDVVAKIAEKPLYQVLAERFNHNQADRDVFVYAAGGYYYPEKDKAALCAEMKTYLDMGYNTVKIKIGGVSLDEVDPSTMESKISPGLYFAGEILNIDGFTGGFNLQASWATGHLVGESIGSKGDIL